MVPAGAIRDKQRRMDYINQPFQRSREEESIRYAE
jgi:hypothetical protein